MTFFHTPTGHVEWRIDRRNPQPAKMVDVLLRTKQRRQAR
jgi:hypothetical protein